MLNSNIIFPNGIDTFPNLSDNQSGVITRSQTFFSQYYDKIRGCILLFENLITLSSVASGDGTFRGISYTYNFQVDIYELAKVIAPFIVSETTEQFPGNVLPFEFVLSYSTSEDYTNWKAGTQKFFVQDISSGGVSQQCLQGLPWSNPYPICGVTIFNKALSDNGTAGISLNGDSISTNESDLVINHYSLFGGDTFIIKGCIIDLGSTRSDGQSRWLNYSGYNLNVSLSGFRI